ncbi:MAG TPA: beta-propeller fold lactonase family protein [Terriglobales bacterium]|jgi:YVTN family beta-propeller protein|nr:beta-propeller fold lactonase family protein [Terriglobales bacterium]
MTWRLTSSFFLIYFLLTISYAQTTSGQVEGKPGKNLLLVVNQGDQSMSFVDPEAGVAIGKVKTNEVRAHEVTTSPDGRLAYLPIYGNSGVGKPGTDGRSVEVVDLDKRSIVGTIDLGRPVRPHWVKFGPDGLLYVSAELDKSVDVLDPRSRQRIASIPTDAPESHMVVISPDGHRAYTANVGAGSVSVLDVDSRKLIKVIPVAETVQRISMSLDGRFVFTADQKTPRLAVIDTATDQVSRWISLTSVGYGTAPTRDGKFLLVTLLSANQVAVIDLAEMKQVRTISVGAGPVQILVRPARPLAYVSCSGDGKVAVLDLTTWKVEKLIETGPGADGLAWVERKP